MTPPRVSPVIPMDALYLAVISAAVEPQVPKAPAAPEADLHTDSYLPVSPFSTVRIFFLGVFFALETPKNRV